MTMRKKIVFFGGTFDPPHNEHIAELKAALSETGAQKAIVMPTGTPPHKETFHKASAKDRLEMCKLAFGDMKEVEISDYETLSEGKSYSYITIEHLKRLYPNSDILFLMGTDMLSSFSTWKNPERILKCATPLLCERTGEKEPKEVTLARFKEEFGFDALCLNYCGKELSSSETKFRILLGLPVDAMVKSAVNEYIGAHSVYVPDKFFDFVIKNEKPERVEHTLGVMLMAEELSKREGVEKNKAILSALLHDSGKYLTPSDYPECFIPSDTPAPVVHQYLGAYIAEKVLGVKDEEVINAIKYHTTGRENMSVLEKIIFTADMLERGRTFEGVEELRKKVRENFENGFKASLLKSLEFVKKSGKPICGLTLKAYDYYFKQEKKDGSN